MQKVLISMPDAILSRLKAVVPNRQRSKFVVNIVEKELKKREIALYRCAMKVEKDKALNADMKDWEITLNDGITHESW